MSLPQKLEQQFWQEVIQLEEERRMPYITSVERIGIEKGIQQERQESRQLFRQILLSAVKIFYNYPESDLKIMVHRINDFLQYRLER